MAYNPSECKHGLLYSGWNQLAGAVVDGEI